MAVPRNKQRNLKRLNDQIKKHKDNPRMIGGLKKRVETLEATKG